MSGQPKPIARPVTDVAAAPIYETAADDFSGPHGNSADPRFALRHDFILLVCDYPAIRGWWRCPHCKQKFWRRKPCAVHMGLFPDKPVGCPELLAQVAARREAR